MYAYLIFNLQLDPTKVQCKICVPAAIKLDNDNFILLQGGGTSYSYMLGRDELNYDHYLPIIVSV
jgi:hypothetical protein